MPTSHSHLIPKDPPSYDSIYLYIPNSSSTGASSSLAPSAFQRFLRRKAAFLQRLAAASFVAATVSVTVMLLLWQVQNLSDPPDNGRPWLDPETTYIA